MAGWAVGVFAARAGPSGRGIRGSAFCLVGGRGLGAEAWCWRADADPTDLVPGSGAGKAGIIIHVRGSVVLYWSDTD